MTLHGKLSGKFLCLMNGYFFFFLTFFTRRTPPYVDYGGGGWMISSMSPVDIAGTMQVHYKIQRSFNSIGFGRF